MAGMEGINCYKEYNTKCLVGQEDCALWIAKNMQTWRGQGLRQDPTDPTDSNTRLFRKEVLGALPVPVQNKLSDIPGLDAMSHNQWVETLKHHAAKHQKQERDLDQQAKENSRKLVQVSLEEKKKDKNKNKGKGTSGSFAVGWAGQTESAERAQGVTHAVHPHHIVIVTIK